METNGPRALKSHTATGQHKSTMVWFLVVVGYKMPSRPLHWLVISGFNWDMNFEIPMPPSWAQLFQGFQNVPLRIQILKLIKQQIETLYYNAFGYFKFNK